MHRLTTVLFPLVILVMAQAPSDSLPSKLSGDPEALATTEKLIEAMGGKVAWANAKGIHVILEGDYSIQNLPWKETYWLDFTTPRGRYEIASPETNRTIAWTLEGGWNLIDDEFTEQDAAGLAVEMDYYRSEPTVVIQRLAKQDPDLEVSLDRSESALTYLIVKDVKENVTLCKLGLNKRYEPVFWTADFNNTTYERILGPLKSYESGVRLYEWGTSRTGAWRYTHKKVVLLYAAPNVDYNRPLSHQ